MKKWLPWILAGAFAAWIVAGAKPARVKEGFDFREFGRLPVLLGGRVQPFDSVARNALLSMRGKQTVPKVKGGTYISATEWLVDAMVRPEEADQYKSFRVQHPEVQGLLGVQGSGLEYLSFNEIAPHLRKIEEQARPILRAEQEKKAMSENRTPFQKDLIHLYSSLNLYYRLKNSLQPDDSAIFLREHLTNLTDRAQAAPFAEELSVYRTSIRSGMTALQATEQGKAHDEQALQSIVQFFKRYRDIEGIAYPLVIPPANVDQNRDDWKNIGRSLMESMKSGEIHPAFDYFGAMIAAVNTSRPAEFNKAVTGYREWLLSQRLLPEVRKGQREFFFNQVEPFYKSMVVYVAALLFGCAYWLRLSEWVRKTAFYLLVVAFTVHTVGLVFRMVLEGRPPVTNLYSSAIFVGWGAVVLGIILERFFRDGIGIVVAAVVGFCTLIIAHHLAAGGDTMEMLRAVLDTNFWLATHVVMITTGYASMFVAGFLAILYIVRGLFTRTLGEGTAKALTRMVYGITCFSTLFSFVGTILGGIWADQSWGRFWGWDPKENGALLIVIWCAIVLHARWAGMVKERGLMALAVFGNIVTSFSWFGVNMLGVGLHAYGFMDKAFKWLMIFVVSQVIFILLAMLPTRFWLSFRGRRSEVDERPSRDGGFASAKGARAPVGA